MSSLERYGQLLNLASEKRRMAAKLLFEQEGLLREADSLLSKHLGGLRVEELKDLENYKQFVRETLLKRISQFRSLDIDSEGIWWSIEAIEELKKELKL